MDKRLIEVENKITKIVTMEDAAEKTKEKVDKAEKNLKDFEDRIHELEGDLETEKAKSNRAEIDVGKMQADVTSVSDKVDKVDVDCRLAIDNTVMSARTEFQTIRTDMGLMKDNVEDLAQRAAEEFNKHVNEIVVAKLEINKLKQDALEAFGQVKEKVEEMERRGTGGKDKKMAGFVLLKNLEPKTYTGKLEEWKSWKNKCVDYLEVNVAGMRQVMETGIVLRPWRQGN